MQDNSLPQFWNNHIWNNTTSLWCSGHLFRCHRICVLSSPSWPWQWGARPVAWGSAVLYSGEFLSDTNLEEIGAVLLSGKDKQNKYYKICNTFIASLLKKKTHLCIKQTCHKLVQFKLRSCISEETLQGKAVHQSYLKKKSHHRNFFLCCKCPVSVSAVIKEIQSGKSEAAAPPSSDRKSLSLQSDFWDTKWQVPK